MKKLIKNRILVLTISLAILLIINISTSYSYYIGKVVGNEESTTFSITSAGAVINFENDNEVISDSNITPGWTASKNFTITSTLNENEINNDDTKLWYVVKLCIDNNDFPTNAIEFSLSQNGNIVGGGTAIENISNIGIETGKNADGIILGIGNFAIGENTHNYTLTINYVDSNIVDPQKTFGIHLAIQAVKPAKVLIDLDGGTYESSTTKYIAQGILTTIEKPTKPTYIFTGWEITSGNGSAEGTKIISNENTITIRAKYEGPYIFETDSWTTIANNVSRGQASVYEVGDEKEILIDENSYTVRIANNSNYDCTLDSQTACGFVVEFKDIISMEIMNSTGISLYLPDPNDGTNKGGWPNSYARTYLNETVYNKLPNDLQSIIANTTVVSGYDEYYDSENFISNDKLYLLSEREVFNSVTNNDTAALSSRQLDYYANIGVTKTNYSGAIKQYNATAANWWLRVAVKSYGQYFVFVDSTGASSDDFSSRSKGIAPAFRIA